jgi:uncharacterized membrane protein YqgA involved in biofilm formation
MALSLAIKQYPLRRLFALILISLIAAFLVGQTIEIASYLNLFGDTATTTALCLCGRCNRCVGLMCVNKG